MEMQYSGGDPKAAWQGIKSMASINQYESETLCYQWWSVLMGQRMLTCHTLNLSFVILKGLIKIFPG